MVKQAEEKMKKAHKKTDKKIKGLEEASKFAEESILKLTKEFGNFQDALDEEQRLREESDAKLEHLDDLMKDVSSQTQENAAKIKKLEAQQKKLREDFKSLEERLETKIDTEIKDVRKDMKEPRGVTKKQVVKAFAAGTIAAAGALHAPISPPCPGSDPSSICNAAKGHGKTKGKGHGKTK